MQNPFTISFGKEPYEYINRTRQENSIIEDFQQEYAPNNVAIILGPRGSGKTVMLNHIANFFEKDDSWIVVRLSIATDMLSSLSQKLQTSKKLEISSINAKVDLPGIGIGVTLSQSDNAAGAEVAIEKMLQLLQNKGQRLLITVDEASSTSEMRKLASIFQLFLGQNYPIFMLMTGLYEEIDALQNSKNLTFLLRAPKIYIEPLNYTRVKKSYKTTLGVSDEMAHEMATVVGGYSFGFQALGYLYYNKRPTAIAELYNDFDDMLAEYVYDKIWEQTGGLYRKILLEMALHNITRISELQTVLHLSNSEMSPYRSKLIKRGIVRATARGELEIALPRFKEYLIALYE
ncbi:MAG: ATP-binding protein [Firmicutes bacterium]|nr:ATP-binding protein [Bacillota bacterium]